MPYLSYPNAGPIGHTVLQILIGYCQKRWRNKGTSFKWKVYLSVWVQPNVDFEAGSSLGKIFSQIMGLEKCLYLELDVKTYSE